MSSFSDPVRSGLELSSAAYLALQLRETELDAVGMTSSDAVLTDANSAAARLFGVAGREHGGAVGIASLIVGRSLSELVVLNELENSSVSAAMLLSPLTEQEPGEDLRIRRLVAGRWMILRGRRISRRELVVVIERAMPEEWPFASEGPLLLLSYDAQEPFRIRRCSNSALARLGRRAETLVGSPFPELLPGQAREELAQALESFRDSETQRELELHYSVNMHDGATRLAHDYILPLGDARGVHGFISHIWIEK